MILSVVSGDHHRGLLGELFLRGAMAVRWRCFWRLMMMVMMMMTLVVFIVIFFLLLLICLFGFLCLLCYAIMILIEHFSINIQYTDSNTNIDIL